MKKNDIYEKKYISIEMKYCSLLLNSFCVNDRNKVEIVTHYRVFPIESPYHIGSYCCLPELMANFLTVRGNLALKDDGM